MAGISSKAAGVLENKDQKFQGQKIDDDLGLNWIQFKWRNHDPQIGRFIEIDPLSDKYVHNSTYAFSENKVTTHVELEGLEAEAIFNQLRNEVKKEFVNFGKQIDRFFSVNEKTTVSTEVLKTSNVTQSVGSSTTNTTRLNLGGLMTFLTVNNTLNGYKGPFIKTEQSTTLETKTEVKVGAVTLTNKTSVDINTGVTTNESGGKGSVIIRGAPVELEGSGGPSSDGKSKATIQASTGTTDSKILVNSEVTTSNQGTNLTFNIGGQQKTGKTTTRQTFGFGFSW